MPLSSKQSAHVPDLRVVIRNHEGKYLAGGTGHSFFTEERSSAAVFLYVGDRVAEQLEAVRETQGLALEAVPIPVEEIYEMCDRCKEFFMPFMVFFDGRTFMCADCRNRAKKRRAQS
jgi:hypothetical protein